MKRVHMHWTAGADGVTPHESDSYHFVIGRDGSIHEGVPVERNVPPLVNGAYAAHTLNANSWAIGVAIDAMAGAKERPFSAGPYPASRAQIDALVGLVARLCIKHGISVTRQTVLTHAEVERTLGIKQRNKWDIMWLPGMLETADPIKVGDKLRQAISKKIEAETAKPKRNLIGIILDLIARFFK